MIFDNINIQSKFGNFEYIIGYDPLRKDRNTNVGYLNNDNVFFIDDNIEYIRTNNTYQLLDTTEKQSTDLPSDIKYSKLKIFFPRYSIETYSTKILYALTICTWINGKKIDLGTSIINRNDSIANVDYKIAEDDYYDYISINIIDPYEIIYSDDWKNFRINVCGEKSNRGVQLNNTGSFLYCVLQPVIKTDDNTYIICDDYTGGQNSLNISSDSNNDYLDLNISDNINNDSDENIHIKSSLTFNQKYKNNLHIYLKETYNIEAKYIYFGIVLCDKENRYNDPVYSDSIEIQKTYSNKAPYETTYIFNKNNLLQFKDFTQESYIDGMKLVGTVLITNEQINPLTINDQEKVLLRLISNDIILTKEKFNYFINNDGLDHINLKDIENMKVIQINAVNKIENKIVQLDKPNDSKANIIMPVFFKVNDLANIVIHPDVNENICINLDSYKSKVRTFIIQIEGIQFKEIGRTESGVIFKITGKKLPKVLNNGTYYILNQDLDMIVSGKYKYEV